MRTCVWHLLIRKWYYGMINITLGHNLTNNIVMLYMSTHSERNNPCVFILCIASHHKSWTQTLTSSVFFSEQRFMLTRTRALDTRLFYNLFPKADSATMSRRWIWTWSTCWPCTMTTRDRTLRPWNPVWPSTVYCNHKKRNRTVSLISLAVVKTSVCLSVRSFVSGVPGQLFNLQGLVSYLLSLIHRSLSKILLRLRIPRPHPFSVSHFPQVLQSDHVKLALYQAASSLSTKKQEMLVHVKINRKLTFGLHCMKYKLHAYIPTSQWLSILQWINQNRDRNKNCFVIHNC